MNNMIDWMAKNPVAANLLMLLILVAGVLNFPNIRKETFPEVSLDMIVTSVAYPGASAEEVEQSVCVRIEEKIHDLIGIKQLSSTAREGLCAVSVEVDLSTDTQKMLDEIKSRVDAITSFPEGVERPTFREVQFRRRAIGVTVAGQTDERTLKKVAEQIRDGLSALDEISQIDLLGTPQPEIRIEVSESDLQRYGLTLGEIANSVRRSSLDLPGGSLKTDSGDVWIRTLGQATVSEQFSNITLLSQTDGSTLKLGDVATIIDSFKETDKTARFNGKPTLYLSVKRVGEESILEVTDAVKRYITDLQPTLPAGIEVTTWRDSSVFYRSRAELLLKNGAVGLTLVFAVLVLFLQFRLAFWVALGIPISFMGTLLVLPILGGSINMVSMFAFILVLGIVVDDAIVVGENVHTHQRRTGNNLLGAIQGTQEVAKPVVFAVLTTVVAFMPMLYLPGVNGQVWKIIPIVVIATLLFSLLECLVILPAHLGAMREQGNKPSRFFLARIQTHFSNRLESFVHNWYTPLLERAIRWRYATVSIFLVILMLAWGLIQGGFLKVVFFPQVQSDFIVASISFPQGTPEPQTRAAVDKIEQAAFALQKQYLEEDGVEPILNFATSISQMNFSSRSSFTDREGSHVGEVALELAPAESRTTSTKEVENRWRQLVGDIPGALQLKYNSSIFTGGSGIEIQLEGRDVTLLQKASETFKQQLRQYEGIHQVSDSNRGGKSEIHLSLRDGIEHLGLRLDDIARQVKQGFYGEEVQRIQRGRDEVKIWIRYPLSERRTLQDLESIQIRLPDGTEIPFNAVAKAEYARGEGIIERRDRKRIISIAAEVDHSKAESGKILTDLRQNYLPALVKQYPGVSWSMEGNSKSQQEIMQTIVSNGLLALLAIYALMAIPFSSYAQPLIIMSAIPFGLVGAVIGHFILGLNMSLLSMSGMIAVAGVVVNDNLVLVDYVNRARQNGGDLFTAIKTAGAARFRPITLTSLTTFVGLMPLMLERSVQAQFLIPMAASLAFGVAFATFVSLLFVPASYHVVEDIKSIFKSSSARQFEQP